MSVSGYQRLDPHPIKGKEQRHTARASSGLRLRMVLGVLPRSLPGVLKISVMLLFRGKKTKYQSSISSTTVVE